MNAKKKAIPTKSRKEPLAFFFCWTSGIEGSTALSPEGVEYYLIPQNQYIENWEAVRLDLPKPYFEDYLGNDMGFRLFSERFRDFIEQHKQPKDSFQWLENPVFCGEEKRPYFILHFYNTDDVLDKSRIIWHPVDQSILKPVFCAKKIQGHSIFTYLDINHLGDIPFVTQKLKCAILNTKMTGVTFEASAVVDDLV